MCNVLIVSPVEETKQSLRYILNKYFANVFVLPYGETGDDALTIAKVTQPEIIILDVTAKNALGIHPQLIQLHPNLRTIIIDQEENFQHAQQAIRMGALDYFVAPLVEKEVLNGLHRTIISLNQVSLLSFRDKNALPTQNEMILPMIQYIHTNYANELTLDVLSKFMHLNKDYLSKLFKREVGMTFIAYLNHYRVEQAKLLLRTTDDSLAEIASAVGYSDPAYFSRIFKKITDLSPNQYRQTYVGDFIPSTVY